MSMVMCERCDRMIDSDDDPDCFCEAPDYMPADFRKAVGTEVVCEPCRERQWEHDFQRQMEGSA